MTAERNARRGSWLTPSLLGLAAASFFSDIGHEMATAVLPIYLGALGLGAAALGAVEGTADLLNSLSKLAGGYLGQRLPRKKTPTALGYLVTAGCTAGLSFARGFWGLLTLRGAAWIGRGYRSPLKDFLMSDAVPPTRYGRAFGLERAGDMAGAVAGPLCAALLLGIGLGYRGIFIWALIPGALAAVCVLVFVKERPHPAEAPATIREIHARLPAGFGRLLAAILVFGMGDFSRTFLILAAARGLGMEGPLRFGPLLMSIPVCLYVIHNAVSALATFPAGRAADRWSKRKVLAAGYALGAACNGLLFFGGGSLPAFLLIFMVSGAYIAVEETVEKACVSEILPRAVRSYGLGILATANAAGDMLSSVYVGALWEWAGAAYAFGIATAFSCAGCVLLTVMPPPRPCAGE